MTRPTDFRALIETLTAANVDFIVVGGIAAAVRGSARATLDLDVVYRRANDNLARLTRALAPLAPYLRGAPPGLPFVLDEATLQRGLNFTLDTSLGALDLLGRARVARGRRRTRAVRAADLRQPRDCSGDESICDAGRSRRQGLSFAQSLHVAS